MQIEGHSFKPKPHFYGKDAYHLGVELEVEAPDPNVMTAGLNLMAKPTYCYAKHDGSLGPYGWELVTHPIARKSWLAKRPTTSAGAFFKYVQSLRELGYSSHVPGTCGLHIHVSLPAFNNVKLTPNSAFLSEDRAQYTKNRMHVYWFVRLINSDLFRKLSQRQESTLNRWAKIRAVNALDFIPQEGESQETRYLATNFTRHTCEVRLFRGNMREDRIRKAVESVIAAVEFTRNLGSKDYKASAQDQLLPVKNFIQYIANNEDLYPNLCAFLIEIGQLPEKKGGNTECVS